MGAELRFLTSDFYNVEIPLTYALKAKGNSYDSIYLRSVASWRKSSEDIFGERKSLLLAIGLLF